MLFVWSLDIGIWDLTKKKTTNQRKTKMGKKTVVRERITSQDIVKLTRHSRPDHTSTVWSVSKFAPDHCPNCGHEFKTTNDYAFSGIDPKLKRYYMNHLMHKHGLGIAICRHCGNKTALVEIANCYVATKHQAKRLIEKENYTSTYPRAVTPEEKKKLIAEGVELYPYGIGLKTKKIDVPTRGKSKKDFAEGERRYKDNKAKSKKA